MAVFILAASLFRRARFGVGKYTTKGLPSRVCCLNARGRRNFVSLQTDYKLIYNQELSLANRQEAVLRRITTQEAPRSKYFAIGLKAIPVLLHIPHFRYWTSSLNLKISVTTISVSSPHIPIEAVRSLGFNTVLLRIPSLPSQAETISPRLRFSIPRTGIRSTRLRIDRGRSGTSLVSPSSNNSFEWLRAMRAVSKWSPTVFSLALNRVSFIASKTPSSVRSTKASERFGTDDLCVNLDLAPFNRTPFLRSEGELVDSNVEGPFNSLCSVGWLFWTFLFHFCDTVGFRSLSNAPENIGTLCKFDPSP